MSRRAIAMITESCATPAFTAIFAVPRNRRRTTMKFGEAVGFLILACALTVPQWALAQSSGSMGSGVSNGALGQGSFGDSTPKSSNNTTGPSTTYSNTQYGTTIFQNPIGIGQSPPVGTTPASTAQQQRNTGIGGK